MNIFSLKKFVIALLIFVMGASNVLALGLENLTPEEDISGLKESLSGQLTENSMTYCAATLTPLYDLELQEFLTFLDVHFRNKSSNSSLNNIAIARYVELKQALDGHFSKLRPNYTAENDKTGIDELRAYEICSSMTDAYLDLAKDRMMQHIKNSTAQKKTVIMLEKYKSINNKMRDLHLQVSRMYGFFKAFNQKLPGFVEECIQ